MIRVGGLMASGVPRPRPRLRFAPSPTGYLHIGGVRTALFNWLWARKTNGVFVLRIEDTDQERSTDASRKVIIDSMNWLGLTWDEGPGVGGEHGPYTQMERLPIYKEYAQKLIEQKKAFRCYCTKEDLDAARQALKKKDPKAAFKYPGTCRNRTDEPANLPFVVRFKAPTDGSITYVDKVFGEIVTPNVENQDFVLLRSDGIPLYNFGCVVDDHTMGITLVARGRDHMINTPPQILLYNALGVPVPEFAHLPMILAANGERLSKRHGAVSVDEYRLTGYSPMAVLNYLARFGWSFGDQEVFSRQELIDAFDWANCGRGDGKFDAKKFVAINHEHLKTDRLTSTDDYVTRLRPFLAERNGLVVPSDDAAIAKIVPLIRDRATTFVEAANMMDFFFREPQEMDAKAVEKFLSSPETKQRLAAIRTHLETSVTTWDEGTLEASVHGWVTGQGLEMKAVGQPIRVALTGRTASPGLFQMMVVMGKDLVLARLGRAAS
jgi:glutamyl-tRNA synthetase